MFRKLNKNKPRNIDFEKTALLEKSSKENTELTTDNHLTQLVRLRKPR